MTKIKSMAISYFWWPSLGNDGDERFLCVAHALIAEYSQRLAVVEVMFEQALILNLVKILPFTIWVYCSPIILTVPHIIDLYFTCKCKQRLISGLP
jgi:hypothetical protein